LEFYRETLEANIESLVRFGDVPGSLPGTLLPMVAPVRV